LYLKHSGIEYTKFLKFFQHVFEDVNKATVFLSVPIRKVFKLLKPLLLHLYKWR